MDSEKHETMFRVKNERITFKARNDHLLSIDVGNICVDRIIENEMGRAENVAKASPKKKKVKSKWVKQYLFKSKGRKWMRKSHPKKNSPIGELRILEKIDFDRKGNISPPRDGWKDGPYLQDTDCPSLHHLRPGMDRLW
ncbi:hypothetical protein HAX54_009479 [Datura stramonium]|uniref:Uncharacterized protein n=1 Tax=Datura stramonium TaxID=4076 RepID=A0ABS8TG88_DATST|nr:hypothetical protein [Datura stramonium]